MAESPVKLSKVDCGNGTNRVVVREREYDLRSWHGLKTLFSVVITVGGIIAAVLTAYYTAEASQNAGIDSLRQSQTEIKTKQTTSEKSIAGALEKIDQSLGEQRTLLDKTRETLIQVDTRQQGMKDYNENVSKKLDALAEEIRKTHR